MQNPSDPDEHAIEQTQIALEYARLAQEEMLRLKELGIREKELELEATGRRFNWLASPAVVAIAAGLIGYLSTLYSSYATRQLEANRQKSTEKMEQEKDRATLQLAREKQEGTVILEAIKSEGTKDEKERGAAANLVFLADAGLITSLKKEALDRLREKAGNALPSLPSGTDLEFQRSPALTNELQVKLQKELGRYQQYLIGIGYDAELAGKRIPVNVDEEEAGKNAFFDGEALHIGKNLTGDPEYAITELTWVMLKRSNPEAYDALAGREVQQLSGFAQSLKFYFSCSYRNDPHIGKNYWELTGTPVPPDRDPQFLFDLTTRNPNQASEIKTMEQHKLGELWGAGLWALRAKLGQKPTDKLVYTTWKRLKPVSGQLGKPKFYVDTIIAAAEEMKLQLDEQFIRQVFAERNLK